MASSHVLISCGSFNPITVMHLRMFELARHHLKTKKGINVEKGVISPTNDCYALIKPSLSPATHRLAMIRLALRDVDANWIVCDDWETKQNEWIRTLPALRHYSGVYGNNLKLLCGADLLESFLIPNLWSDEHIEEILRDFGIVAIPRPGSNPWKLLYDSSKSHIFQQHINQIVLLEEDRQVNISSTMVRDAVKDGKPIEHLVHPSVEKYIRDKGLYKY
uniref:Nicotinamide-nucleotide adenylyltransferase n=1 Tax=Aceria tosichella TaxID=561515 RepID=A0A6G1SQI4_9ACAR